MQYLIVGTTAEYQRWCDANQPVFENNQVKHVLADNVNQLRGHSSAKVIVFESVLNHPNGIEIMNIRDKYKEGVS